MESPYAYVAKALYKHWQTSDKELLTDWEDAPDHLRRVFLTKAEVAVEALYDFNESLYDDPEG